MCVLYVAKFRGPFGFIKPFTAVRDETTFSQQFLTASTLEGIEKKLFPETLSQKGLQKIARYKIIYTMISLQKEVTQTRGWEYKKQQSLMIRNRAVLERGLLIDPELLLAFIDKDSAEIAIKQHICVCRNEDILLPDPEVVAMDENAFNELEGFELRFGEAEDSFITGFHRFDNATPMYGRLEITGNPVNNKKECPSSIY
ncbi:hypothetical protein DVR12_18250 [Chitinophaga silvatica]|uniref:Uncharacterized protein n=1 Tax=Chitinophaga silvatica TaxID=2282649 RepID=A0A3E1Y6H8_9BACT|nr:hypothetical protein [Chitinophaga silvatica]RFS20511.1 hypothetical protein DVR12_18250 [Chitinophaga silvatica]